MVERCVASHALCVPSALAQPPAAAWQGAVLLSNLLLAMLMHAQQRAVHGQSLPSALCTVSRAATSNNLLAYHATLLAQQVQLSRQQPLQPEDGGVGLAGQL